MHKFSVFFILLSFTAQGQIQFWTKNDMLEKQFQPARAELKIKTAYNFITSERWGVNDSTDYNEIIDYDNAGRKIVYKKIKTDWANKRKHFLYIDSFFYNDKGVFTAMRRYNPKGNKEYYALEYEARSVLNAKGQIEKMNFYNGYGVTEPGQYDVYTYDGKNRIIKISTFTSDGKKDYEWKFEYDANGRLAKVRFGAPAMDFTDHIIKYNAKGLMSSYSELFNGKEKQGETIYTYDEKNRLVRKEYKTNYAYADTTQYWYNGDEKLYYKTYLKFPAPLGSDRDFSHEFLVYKFDRFE